MTVTDERVWLAIPVGAAAVVFAAYLLSHEYPAYGAGMYFQIGKQIRIGGYRPPVRIHHYTAGGVPYAYPPLLLYVAAVVRDLTGVSPLTYARFVPGSIVVATVVPYYYLAGEFLRSRPRASLAAVVFAVAPPVLTWHLSAGGIVRAPAFLFTLAGVYGGVRLFRAGDRRWIVPSTVLFGLSALSHPSYPVYFVLSLLLLYAVYDRSLRGLRSGVMVGVGGLALTVPWIAWVATTHGLDIFAAAAGTHSGLGGGTYRIWQEFVAPVGHLDVGTPFYALAYLGAVVALARRRPFLPAWMVAGGYVLSGRFLYVVGAMLVPIAVFEGPGTASKAARYARRRARAAARRGAGTTGSRGGAADGRGGGADGRPGGATTGSRGGGADDRRGPGAVGYGGAGAAVLVAVAAVALGGLFGAGALTVDNGNPTQPAFLDRGDVRAATWVERNTAPGADFVVVGDDAEWFPYLADRTILVGPWGTEWLGNAQYRRQIRLFEWIAACDSARCLTTAFDRADIQPEYTVVPKGHYTVRGQAARTSPQLRRTLRASDRYTLVDENPDTMIFRVSTGRTRPWPCRGHQERPKPVV